MQSALKPLALAILLAGVSVAAHAETSPYSQFVNFGDSLSDAGNFPDVGSPLLGGNPTGGLRFTNRTGPTYAANNTEYVAIFLIKLTLAALIGMPAWVIPS